MKTSIFNRLFAVQGLAISIILSLLMMATLPWSASAQTAISGVPAQTSSSITPAPASKPLLRNTFDHLKTGFPLRAAHLNVACETCHVGGTFKGTPKDCAGCHSVGKVIAATPKTQDHIPTTKPCDACHANGASFLTAVMDHTGLTEPCSVCHGGSYSPVVKSVPHDSLHEQNSNIPCDSCHKNTFTFTGSRFDHANTVGDCIKCHNGTTAQGQNLSTHINTSSTIYPVNGTQPCENCHTPAVTPGWPTPTSFLGAVFNHNTTGNTIGSHTCLSCHVSLPGVKSQTSITGHVSTSLQCDACHTSTDPGGFTSWVMDHADNNNLTGCASCHTGAAVGSAIVKGKSIYHIPNTPVCENCHSNTSPNGFTSWTMETTGHNAISPTLGCNICHRTYINGGDNTIQGTTVKVKGQPTPPIHIPNSPACESCHTSTISGGFPTWTMNHNAISPTLSCAACHDTGAPVPTGAALQPVVTKPATGTPSGHIPVPSSSVVDCGQCHKTTANFKTWLTTDVHAAAAGFATCASCHSNGTTTSPGSSTSTGTSAASYLDATVVSYPPNHNVNFPATVAATVSSTSDCSGCHNTTSFFGSAYGHDMTAAGINAAKGNCTLCHNSNGGTGKTFGTQHIPSSQPGVRITNGVGECDNCHTDSYSSFSFLSETISHTSGKAYPATAKCSDCHGGKYLATEGVKSLPTTGHIPYTLGTSLDCNACHKTTTTFTGWLASDVHTAVNAGTSTTYTCATCHDSTQSYTGVVVKPSGSPAAHISYNAGVDCGSSSCHTSLTTFKTWTMGSTGHGQVNTVPCATCHDSTATVPASVVLKPTAATPGTNGPTLHIPVNTTATCDQCHSSYATFTTWTMNHTTVNGIACSACHAPNGITFKDVTLVTISPTHDTFLPPGTSVTDCSLCHNTTTFFGATNGHDMTPAGILKNTNNCASCHKVGGPVLQPKSIVVTPPHIPVGNPINQGDIGQCDYCHTAGYTTFTFTGAIMNHSKGYPSGTKCSACHSATPGYVSTEGVKALPAGTPGKGGHISLAYTGYNDCNDCHKGTSTFTGWVASDVHNAVGASISGSATRCDSCHGNGMTFAGLTLIKTLPTVNTSNTTSHIAFTTGTDCNACHTSLSTFTSWTMGANHSKVSTFSCASCHDNGATVPASVVKKPTPAGAGVSGQSGTTTHIPYNSGTTCDQCHGTGYVSFTTWNMIGSTYHSLVPGGTTPAGPCENCHGTGKTFYNATLVNYTTPTPSHDAFAIAHGSPANFISTQNCASCHSSTTSFLIGTSGHGAPGSTQATADAGNCGTNCHKTGGNPPALMYTTGIHIPTVPAGSLTTKNAIGQCDWCHTASYTTFSFAGATMDHTHGYTAGTRCDTCHIPAFAKEGVKTTANTTHIPIPAPGTGIDCGTSSCHKNTTSFTGTLAADVHAAINAGTSPNTCISCHDSSKTYTGVVIKPAAATAHISYNSPATTDCSVCHTGASGMTTFTSWTMSTTGHNIVNSFSCASCHDNGANVPASVVMKPAPAGAGVSGQSGANTHIPYNSTAITCDQCHGTSYSTFTSSSWTPLDATKHGYVNSFTCASCHSPNTATFRDVSLVTFPQTHPYALSTSNCATCHTSFTSFLGATNGHDMTNSGIQNATKNCAQSGCHSGSGTTGKVFTTGVHIPSSAGGAVITGNTVGQCDNCHTSSYTSLSFAGATISHTPGTAYPATPCYTCHGGTLNNTGTAFASEGVKNSTATTHIPFTTDCNTCHTGGFTSFAAPSWTASTVHTVVGAGTASITCASCHDTSKTYSGVKVKPSGATSHIAYNTPTTTDCNVCHTGASGMTAFTSWTMASTGHAAVNSYSCASCHDTGASVPASVVTKPVAGGPSTTNHIQVNAGVTCDQCHGTGYSSFKTWTMNTSVNHGYVNSYSCSSCHSPTGATYYDVALVSFPAVHTWAANNSVCSTCHTSFTTFLGASGHTAPTLTGTCAQSGCHSGTGATGKVFAAQHIPTVATTSTASAGAIVNGTSTGQCDNCHTASYASMSFLTETMSHTTGYITGIPCDTCHAASTTYPASEGVKTTTATNHISLASLPAGTYCSACHTSTATFTAWTASTVHSVVNGIAAYTCASCHDNTNSYSGVVVKPTGSSHIPIAAGVACNSSGCHSSTTSPGGFATWTMGAAGHTSANGGTPPTTCNTCHLSAAAAGFTNTSGTPIVAFPATTHIPVYGLDCASCHTATFTPGSFTTSALAAMTGSGTTSGHGLVLAAGKVAQNANGGTCAPCHDTAGSVYTGVKTFDTAHISKAYYPAGEDCNYCHNAGNSGSYAVGGFSVTPKLMQSNILSHNGTGGSYPCWQCHNGTIATGTSSYTGHTAVNTATTDCIPCHAPSQTAYTNFLGATGGHTLAYVPNTAAAGSPPNGAQYNCANASCHSGTGTTGKVFTAQHIPSSLPGATIAANGVGQCDYCHSQASYTNMTFTTYTSATIHNFGTSIATGTLCSKCHNGTYTAEGTIGAQATTLATGGHIPTTIVGTQDCTACHYYPSGAGIVVSATGFSGSKSTGEYMNHNLAKGSNQPAGIYCVTCHLSSVKFMMSGAQKVSHNGASTSKDCSSTSCHKPLGNQSSFGNYSR